jgi:K(+)-stimulated pyrophosphate-energized sodium pump
MPIILLPIFAALLLTIFGTILFFVIQRGTPEKSISTEITVLAGEGLSAFTRRLLSSILQIICYLSICLFLISWLLGRDFPFIQTGAFFLGGVLMALASILIEHTIPRMLPSIIANSKVRFQTGLIYLLSASSAVSFIIVGMTFLLLIGCYLLLGIESTIGFGVGIILAAFFLRIGGGMFKATADITSDSVSKIENKIPHFDRRNPASILDITGDIIGDIVGYGSDIIGSFVFAIIACLLFAYSINGDGVANQGSTELILLPLFIVSIGFIASICSFALSVFRIKTKRSENVLLEGIYLAVVLVCISTYFITSAHHYSADISSFWGLAETLNPFFPYLFGLLGAIFIAFTSEFITSNRFFMAKYIAKNAEYGAVVSSINGLAVGLRGNMFFLIYLLLIALPAFYFAGFYGIAMAAMGMLSVTPLIFSANIFSPLATNVRKICELSDIQDHTIRHTRRLDEIGSTTVALGNGFATGASVLATFSLFFSLLLLSPLDLSDLLLIDIQFLSGIMIGSTIPYVSSGYLLSGLSVGITQSINEVTRQFREIPYLRENKARPDIIKAADLISIISMNSMLVPALLTVLVPIIIGVYFGIKIMVGLTLGTLLTGFNKAFYWAHAGDAVHSAKHYIESGHYGGTNTPTYDSIVIADNIGDAYKDLLGPSMNILIKTITIITILVILI